MKLLGKRSLSSFLKVLLDVVFYSSVVATVLLIVVIGLAGLNGSGTTDEEFPIAFDLDESAYSMRSSEGAENVKAEIVEATGNLRVTRSGDSRVLLRLLFVLPAFGVVILVVQKLRQLFRRLIEGRPFAVENAKTLRFIAVAVVAAELLWAGMVYWTTTLFAAEFTTSGIALRPEFPVRLTVVLIGLVLLIVAEVFRLGAIMRSDLDTAREIQFSLVPDPDYENGPISIHSRMEPARTVGGDYYDVVDLDDGRLAFVVADVAGKGIPAALLMALLQGSLRSLLSSGLRGAELVTRLNDYLVANTPANRMITFFYGELDPASGELRYVNAGHNPPFLSDGSSVVRLGPTGVVLGVLDGAPFAEERVKLEAQGRILLYTDGVSEAANPADEEFGEQRLEDLVAEKGSGTPTSLVDSIVAAVLVFCGKAKPHDDMTMMVVSRGAAVGAEA